MTEKTTKTATFSNGVTHEATTKRPYKFAYRVYAEGEQGQDSGLVGWSSSHDGAKRAAKAELKFDGHDHYEIVETN